jgi:hypothetical protein
MHPAGSSPASHCFVWGSGDGNQGLRHAMQSLPLSHTLSPHTSRRGKTGALLHLKHSWQGYRAFATKVT